MRIAAMMAGIGLAACGPLVTDQPDDNGMTPLMLASQRPDTAALAALLGRVGDVNAEVPPPDRFVSTVTGTRLPPRAFVGYTALMFAVQSRRVENARLLLAGGADVNRVARDGATPLSVAVERNDTAMLRVLMKARARPEPRLMANVIARNRLPVVTVLLQHGMNPNASGPLHPWGRPGDFQPLLVIAVKRGDPDVVRALLAAGARPDTRDQAGWSVLRHAHDARTRNEPRAAEIVAVLDSAGARDTAGIRAANLAAAVERNDLAAVRAGLKAGADPNARDAKGVPVLVHALARRHTAMANELLAAGADVNVVSYMTVSPLTATIENGDLEMTRALLRRGAKADLMDGRGVSPLMITALNARADIARLLLADSTISIPRNALQHAVGRADTAQVRMFLERGADPNAGNGFLLFIAARACSSGPGGAVIAMLLERGVDPKGWSFGSPVHVAAGRCGPETVSAFLARGIDVNRKGGSGATPLMHAAAYGNLANVRLLIARGARVNQRDDDGFTALEYARNAETRKSLLAVGAQGDTTRRPSAERLQY